VASTSKRDIEAEIEGLPSGNIYINVKHLRKGTYALYIVFKQKTIHKTFFKIK